MRAWPVAQLVSCPHVQIKWKAGEMADPPLLPTALVSAGRGDKQDDGHVTQIPNRGEPGVAHSVDRNVPGHSIVESKHSRSSPACNTSGRQVRVLGRARCLDLIP